jgi:hypothetical protein
MPCWQQPALSFYLCACQPRSGLYISLGFFDDVFVPGTNLPMVSYWDESEGSWVWSYEGEKLPFEKGEDIRVKVTRLEFHAVPGPAQLKEGVQQQQTWNVCVQCGVTSLRHMCSSHHTVPCILTHFLSHRWCADCLRLFSLHVSCLWVPSCAEHLHVHS